MTYAVTTDAPGLPAEVYDDVHRRMLERFGDSLDGLLMHLARQTADGMQVIEVWRSQEDYERAGREIVGPVVAEVLAGAQPPEVVVTPFEVRGLVLPAAGVTV
ncbi:MULTISPECIES: hypothetical protein [unclassified Blastococcus]